MSPQLAFESKILDGDILAIVLAGNLDATTTPEFDNEISKHLAQGITKIIIDCRRLGYLSSLGIGALVILQARLRRQGGSVKLAAVQGPVAEVVKVVHLDKMLGIYGDLEFARQSFEK